MFSDWFGLIFLRSGCYYGATFRFHIFIGKNFPQTDIPVKLFNYLFNNLFIIYLFSLFQDIIFKPPIFHPKVDPISGQMETRASFGKWQTGVHHIWHLLLYIKKSLLIIDPADPLNPIAADLYVYSLKLFSINYHFNLSPDIPTTASSSRNESPNRSPSARSA